MPQGSVLGPVLFLIFINDLPEDINSRTRLFADDCILYRQITSENDQQLLQEDLDRLATWEKTWGMEFHPQKCSVMRISRARTPRSSQYHLKGVPLAEEQSSKYLGVDLQSNLSWKNHISRITKKSNNMLGFLRRTYDRQAKKPRHRLISPWYDPTWTTILQSGVHTNVTRNTRSKWSREDLHDLSQTDTETPAASRTCLTISVGSRMKQEEANCS